MRLDQFLVKSNICSRSEAKQLARKGRVSVNGELRKDTSVHIDENADEVKVDGVTVNYAKFHYYMFNKPAGCVSATRDGLSQTVIDYLKGEPVKGLFPVGSLDKDTEGLLIITDDGKLAHNLLSPKKHVGKTYLVLSNRQLNNENLSAITEGIDIGDEDLTLPAKIEEFGKVDDLYRYELTIFEGRFHQVKRMFEACGAKVEYLKRLSMGEVKLDDSLSPGEYRQLTTEELVSLSNN